MNLKQCFLFFTLDFRSNPSFEDNNDNDVVPKPVVAVAEHLHVPWSKEVTVMTMMLFESPWLLSNVAEHLHVPQSKEVTLDDKDLRVTSFH